MLADNRGIGQNGLDISGLPVGLYFLQCEKGWAKFVKQ
jgi:hypothetical protein